MLEHDNSERPILCGLSSRIPHTFGRLHTVSLWMGSLIKPPFLVHLIANAGSLYKKTPHSTHILCHFDVYTHIKHLLTNFTPILCPYNSIFQIPHQILFKHATSHFWHPPPRDQRGIPLFTEQAPEKAYFTHIDWEISPTSEPHLT